MTIEQAIEYVEKVAAEQEYFMGQFDAASGYARSGNEAIRTESAKECEKCAEEHRQLADWLRELQERRKAPEIIRCGECELKLVCCRTIRSDGRRADDFCSCGIREERRTDEVRTP